MQDVFVNPFTDFGFKKLFGEEPNKALLISFLNTLLPDKHQIASLAYRDKQWLGADFLSLSCQNTTGEQFFVELQKSKQNYFIARNAYYADFPIPQQVQRGEWDYPLASVYSVGILDFVFGEDTKTGDTDVIRSMPPTNQASQVFDDKFTFIYLTLPHFRKTLAQLDSLQDKWLYVFKHLHEFDDIPPELADDVFAQVFAVAKIANFSRSDQTAYRDSLKYYWDLKNVIDTAREERWQRGVAQGQAEGIAKTRLHIVRNARQMGMSAETIAAILQLGPTEVAGLLAQVQNG